MPRPNLTIITAVVVAAALCAGTPCAAGSRPSQSGSVGLGFGIPNGILGVNVDLNVHENVAVTAGVGTTVVAGLGWAGGARFFLNTTEKQHRPYIVGVYGVNAAEDLGDSTYHGLNVGVGDYWRFGKKRRHGIEAMVLIIATSTWSDIGTRLKVGFGYRYAF